MKRYALHSGAVVIVLAGVLVGSWHRTTRFQSKQPSKNSHPDAGLFDYRGRTIPVGGLVQNPEGMSHPGDVAGGEARMKRVFQKLVAFRSAMRRLPNLAELCGPAADKRWALSDEDLQVPDAQYGDGYDPKFASQGQIALAFLAPRPNGAVKPAFPTTGEKDVWLACDSYYRRNEIVFRGGRVTTNPEGVHLVLWSDGSIERIPAGREIYYRDSGNSFTRAFPGETGLPKELYDQAEAHRLLQ